MIPWKHFASIAIWIYFGRMFHDDFRPNFTWLQVDFKLTSRRTRLEMNLKSMRLGREFDPRWGHLGLWAQAHGKLSQSFRLKLQPKSSWNQNEIELNFRWLSIDFRLTFRWNVAKVNPNGNIVIISSWHWKHADELDNPDGTHTWDPPVLVQV